MANDSFPSACWRHTQLDNKFMSKHIELVAKEARKRKFDTLVGCGFSSIPWAIRLSTYLRKPYVLVRKWGEPTSSGGTYPVVGRFGPKRLCLMVDDCISSGRTRDHVAFELLKQKAVLVDIVVLNELPVGGLNRWGGTKYLKDAADENAGEI